MRCRDGDTHQHIPGDIGFLCVSYPAQRFLERSCSRRFCPMGALTKDECFSGEQAGKFARAGGWNLYGLGDERVEGIIMVGAAPHPTAQPTPIFHRVPRLTTTAPTPDTAPRKRIPLHLFPEIYLRFVEAVPACTRALPPVSD